MSIFPPEVVASASQVGGKWIKASEFEGEGLTLKIKKVEKVRANNPKYGAEEKDYLVKNEILEVGETFKYLFEDAEGNEREHDSASTPMFIGFQQAELEGGEWVKIRREGKMDKTRYFVEKIEAPEKLPAKKEGASSEDWSGIPF